MPAPPVAESEKAPEKVVPIQSTPPNYKTTTPVPAPRKAVSGSTPNMVKKLKKLKN